MFGPRLKIQVLILTLESGIMTFKFEALISRMDSRFLKHNPDIKPGVETQKIEGIHVTDSLTRVTVNLCFNVLLT